VERRTDAAAGGFADEPAALKFPVLPGVDRLTGISMVRRRRGKTTQRGKWVAYIFTTGFVGRPDGSAVDLGEGMGP